jgi:membrane-bound serine protease (ClpP class)
VALIGTDTCALLLGRFLPRSSLFGRLALGASTAAFAGSTALPNTSAWIGTGPTPLHPAGTAFIENQRLNIVTSGEFIDAGVPVKLFKVQGHRIVVSKDSNP